MHNEFEKDNDFDNTGMYKETSNYDKQLYYTLKKYLFEELNTGGHSYIPEELEFRASSIAYCKRKILLRKDKNRYLSEKQLELISEETQEIPSKFGASIPGQLIHEQIQDILTKKMGDKLKCEEEISYTIGKASIKGHYDLLVEDERGKKVVIDIKTTSARRQWLPKEAHMTQLMAYQGMLGGINGAIFYVHRNDWELSYVPQKFDKVIFSKIVMKIKELADYERKAELPPAIPALPGECGAMGFWKCDYYSICHPDNELDDFEIIEENEFPN